MGKVPQNPIKSAHQGATRSRPPRSPRQRSPSSSAPFQEEHHLLQEGEGAALHCHEASVPWHQVLWFVHWGEPPGGYSSCPGGTVLSLICCPISEWHQAQQGAEDDAHRLSQKGCACCQANARAITGMEPLTIVPYGIIPCLGTVETPKIVIGFNFKADKHLERNLWWVSLFNMKLPWHLVLMFANLKCLGLQTLVPLFFKNMCVTILGTKILRSSQ